MAAPRPPLPSAPKTVRPLVHPPGRAAQLDRLIAQAMDGWGRAHPLTDQRIGVALSGGADSSAMLLAAVQRWPGQVHAAHVNHGMQAAAADFERHCTALCARLQVPLTVLRIQAGHAAGESPEAKARQARYAALAAWATSSANAPSAPIHTVLLGHHADDQVESVLLALSRGAGVAGLAGMGAQFERGGAHFARPLLHVPAQAIRDWLRVQGQGWVEDPSNQDPRFTRNRIRQLLPALYAAFPALQDTLMRSANLCAQAAQLLDERADEDLRGLVAANPGNASNNAHAQQPCIQSLQALSTNRQANAIRRWLKQIHHTTPSQAQLDALLQQLAACRTRGHHIALKVGRGFVVRVGPRLHWQMQL